MFLLALSLSVVTTSTPPAPPRGQAVNVETLAADPARPLVFQATTAIVPGAQNETITLAPPSRYLGGSPTVTVRGTLPGFWVYEASAPQVQTPNGPAVVLNSAVVRPGPGHARFGTYESIWDIYCSTDEMTDERLCWSKLGGTDVSFWTNSTGALRSVCSFGHDFPGRVATYRIDQTPARRLAIDTACIRAPAELQRVRQANTLLFERYEFPDDFGRVSRVSLTGLALVLSVQAVLHTGSYRLMGTPLPPPPAPPPPAPPSTWPAKPPAP